MKTIIKTLPALLLMAALSGCGKDSFDKPDYYTLKASTEFGQGIVDASEGYITHVKTSQETEIMDGVSLLELGYLNGKSHAMQAYIYKVELGAAMVKVSVPDDDTKIEKVQKLTLQANAIENSGKYLVMGGISGGSFNAETGAPSGILYHNSKAYSSNFGKDAAFFAVMKDGAAVCLDASEFEAKKSKVTEAVSGSAMILNSGKAPEALKEELNQELRLHFRPEFLNRIDEILTFHALGKNEIRRIVDLLLERVQKRLNAQEITLEVTGEARDFIGEAGFDPDFGARPLKRAIIRLIETPLSQLLIANTLLPGMKVKVEVSGGELKFTPVEKQI